MNKKIIVSLIILMFLTAPIIGGNAFKYINSAGQINISSNLSRNNELRDQRSLDDLDNTDFSTSMLKSNYTSTDYPKNWDFVKYLSDNPNEYKKIWEPWITKAAIHAIALSSDKSFLAVGGGYLYDNEIHIYRWNYVTKQYDKVWDSGDGIINGDILSLAFGDTDNNNLLEIIVGSADGHIYVFEQRHIYDPITKTENMFDLVWKSDFIGPVWAVGVFDADKDYVKDIIAGTWYDKVYFFEYYNHSKYPFTLDHWIEYREVWNSGELINSHVTSLGFGDINGNGLPDILVGLRNGELILLENNGTVIDVNSYIFPLTQDNSYRAIWRSKEAAFTPILRISINDTDDDGLDEASIIAVTLGAYVLDYNKIHDQFTLIKLYYPPMPYEVGLGVKGEYPIDNWADWMIYGHNIYYYNGTVNMTEPIEDYRQKTGIEFNNTAMGGPPDWQYSRFLSNSTINATAIIDFGVQEEAVGDGSNASDMYILFRYVSGFDGVIDRNKIRFYVSYDGVKYVELMNYTVYNYPFDLRVFFDIDPILANYSWRHIRYLKIHVCNGGKYAIDAVYVYQIDKQLTDVVSTLVTPLRIDYGNVKNYIVFGTIQGKLIMYFYNKTTRKYEMIYDSYYEDNFILNTHIWYLIKTKTDRKYPYWIRSSSYSFNLYGKTMATYDLYDVDKDGDLDLILGTGSSGLMYYDKNLDGFYRNTFIENYVFGQVNTSLTGKASIIPKMGDVLTYSGPELIISYADLALNTFVINIYYLSNQFNFSYSNSTYYSLAEIELTGRLKAELNFESGLIVPFVDFADIDGDDKTDILVSNGKLLLLRCISTNPPQYVLDENYFKEINSNLKRYLIKAQFVDFNKDGVLDIISSYYGKKGSTYYENIGTSSDPKWVEKKQLFANSVRSMNPVTNFAFNNYTHSIVVYEKDLDSFTLVALNNFDFKLYFFNGETSNIDTLAIATYPLLMAINLGPILSSTSLNFGYHIIDVWSTREELRGWTQTVAHADLDGDGKGEIIIGDYDNNVYVFEHLTNNTYKRAYRTMDLYYEFETNLSPYYSGELSGLQGTFKRRIWDHARYIAANTDIDSDGKLEMIVVTKYQVFVFEHIKYENYELAYHYTLQDHPIWNYIYEFTNGISAFAYANDMDYNGYGEVVIAAGGYMLVLELASNGSFVETFSYLVYKSVIETMYYALFGGVPPRSPAYLLPGNAFTHINDYYFKNNFESYHYMEINALAIDDIDNDGHMEIFIGGRNISNNCAPCKDGLLYSIENVFGTYYIKWIAPQEVLWRNEINSIIIDDQDYDGYKEVIIGGSKGIDIFEHTDDNYLTYLKSITSYANHPFRKNSAIINLTQFFRDNDIQSNDIVVLPNGRIVSFFVSYYSESGMGSEIYYSYSDDNGTTWSNIISLTGGSGYGQSVLFEQYISTMYYNGYIHLAWYASVSAVTSQYNVYYAKMNATSLTLDNNYIVVASDDSDSIKGIRIWKYPIGSFLSYYDIGVSYFNFTDNHLYFYVYYHHYNFLGQYWVHAWIPHPDTPKISRIVHGVYYLTHIYDLAYVSDNTWVLLFTGLNSNKSYALYDILAMKTNSTFNWSRPVEVFTSPRSDIYPVLGYYEPTDTVIAMFMAATSSFRYDVYTASSRDKGLTWSEAKEIYKWHPSVIEKCEIVVRYYWLSSRDTLHEITQHYTSLLAMSVNSKGEFAYSFPVWIRYYISNKWQDIYDIVTGYRDNVDWANTKLGKVNVLAVGDSDADNRREIISNYHGDGFTIFEITSSKPGYRKYNQSFILEHLNNTVLDISVGDSNGNNWPEITVAADFGNVYSFEFKYSNWITASLVIPKLTRSETIITGSLSITDFDTANFDSDSELEYYFMYGDNTISIYDIVTKTLSTRTLVNGITQALICDINGDGASEIVLSLDNGTIVILDGELNTVNETSYLAGHMDIRDQYLIVANESAYIVLYNLSTLTVVWEYNLGILNPVMQVTLAYDHESISRILVHLSNYTLFAIDYTYKNVSWITNLKNYGSTELILYDINNNGRDEIIGQNYTFFLGLFGSSYIWSSNITIIDSKNGEVLNAVMVPFDGKFIELKLVNLDNDDYEDIFVISKYGYGVVSSKNYEFVWIKKHSLNISHVSLGDFNGDNFTDYLISIYGNGEFILSNGYGSTYMYYSTENSLNLYLVIGDFDGNNSPEIYGLLLNGTFVIIDFELFSKQFSGMAYEEPYLETSLRTFNDATSGFIDSADFDNDSFEEIVSSNGTHLALISAVNNTVLWVRELNMTIKEMIVGEYRHLNEIVIALSDWEDVSIYDVHGELIYHKQLADITQYWIILKLHLGDFDGDGIGELVVVTNSGTWIVDNNENAPLYGAQGILYTIVGDFDGDGAMDIAYKILVSGNLLVMKGDGSAGLWYRQIGNTTASMKQPDIFALDYNNDSVDDIVFTDSSGEIIIYNGSNGAVIGRISTGIKSYGLSVDLDRLTGAFGALVVKYANYGFFIFDSSGNKLFEFRDKSTASFYAIDVNDDGYSEYFAMTCGKIYGLNVSGLAYYKNLMDATFDITIINEGTIHVKKIAAVSASGNVYIIKLANAIPKEFSRKDNLTSRDNNTGSIMYLVYLPIMIVMIIPRIIILRKKRNPY